MSISRCKRARGSPRKNKARRNDKLFLNKEKKKLARPRWKPKKEEKSRRRLYIGYTGLKGEIMRTRYITLPRSAAAADMCAKCATCRRAQSLSPRIYCRFPWKERAAGWMEKFSSAASRCLPGLFLEPLCTRQSYLDGSRGGAALHIYISRRINTRVSPWYRCIPISTERGMNAVQEGRLVCSERAFVIESVWRRGRYFLTRDAAAAATTGGQVAVRCRARGGGNLILLLPPLE